MKALIAAILSLICAGVQAQTVGAHLGTVHEQSGFNNENPGLYLRLENGVTVGSYFNSIRNQTNYAGYTAQGETFGLSLVVMTGYRPDPVVAPIPSARFALGGGAYARTSFLWSPQGGSAVHFSIEYNLGGK